MYSAKGEEEWYLNMSNYPELTTFRSTDVGGVIDVAARMVTHPGICPPSGLFQAGLDLKDKDDPEKDEQYMVAWAYDDRLYSEFGLLSVQPTPPSDGCSGPTADFGASWDRRRDAVAD